MSQDKQVALVTGGNRGIGYELVKQLALNGFKVIWQVGIQKWVMKLRKNLGSQILTFRLW